MPGPVLAHARAVYLGERDEYCGEDLRPGIRPCAGAFVAAIDRQMA